MKTQLQKDWQRFLNAGAYCTPPGRAQCALSNARTLAEWREAESAGLVRLRAEEQQENYFDVYGEPEGYVNQYGRRISPEEERKRIVEQLDNLGCWYVSSEVWTGEEWEFADGIGMCTGYEHPLSPFENCYVPDLMRSALDKIPVCGEH